MAAAPPRRSWLARGPTERLGPSRQPARRFAASFTSPPCADSHCDLLRFPKDMRNSRFRQYRARETMEPGRSPGSIEARGASHRLLRIQLRDADGHRFANCVGAADCGFPGVAAFF